MEDSFGIAPGPVGTITIDHKTKGAKKLTQALKAWSRALADVESGKIEQSRRSWQSERIHWWLSDFG